MSVESTKQSKQFESRLNDKNNLNILERKKSFDKQKEMNTSLLGIDDKVNKKLNNSANKIRQTTPKK